MAAYDPDNIFAKMLKGEIPCHKIYEDDDALAFLDIMPRTEGHALVITKESAADLFAVSPEGLARLMAVVQKLAPQIKQAVSADGVLPAVVAEVDGDLVHLMDRQVLDRCRGSVSDFRGRLAVRAGMHHLVLPGLDGAA